MTLDSVVAQTFTDFEVLVMDDGSTDNTEAIVNSFLDPRIRYEWAHNSGGPATPRNRGIDAAVADWICFLDADDRWYPGKLKKIGETIETDPDFDLVCHNEIQWVLATGNKTPLHYGPFEADFYQVMLTLGNRVSTSAACVRRDFLNRYRLRFNESANYVIVEDYDLWLRIALHGGVFRFLPDYLGEYVIADNNISSNLQRIEHNHLVLLRDHVYDIQSFQPNKDRLWREVNAELLLTKSKNYFAKKKCLLGARSLLLAFRSSLAGSLKHIFLKLFKKARALERTADSGKDGTLC